MKKIIFFLPVFLTIVLTACNNSDESNKETTTPVSDTLKAKAESLENEVNEGHNVAMPKSIKIPAIQKEIQRLIDSIGKLPAKARTASAPYKAKLQSLQKDLEYAGFAMDKW